MGSGVWSAARWRGDGLSDGLAQVVPQVPPVGDLDRLRRAAGCRVGVGPGAVPADDLHARVPREPGGHGVRGAVGQEVDRAVGADVDQHGAVMVSATQGEIVDPDLHQLAGLGQR